MKNKILLWQFSGFAVCGLLGTLLHFLYEWTDKNKFVAVFSGINESTWQHMKLLYFPLLFFAIIQSVFFKKQKNFWCIKMIGIISGLLLIPVIFYTYNGVFGKSPDYINIIIFFVCDAAAFFIETLLLKRTGFWCNHKWVCICTIIFIGILFVAFTFYPPNIPLFVSPE